MENDKTEMVQVPLPTEIPSPPNLDQIPLDILHSATVEMLIQQNEDLSSRLKVNIRRNSQLEQKILGNQKTMSDLSRQKENVLAQIEIVNEKEKIWTSQKEGKDRQAQSLLNETDLLEQRYNELYTTAQHRSREQQIEIIKKQTKIDRLNTKLSIHQNVRSRAKEKLRGLLLDMASRFNQQQQHIQQSESSNRLIKKNFEGLKNEISEKESFFRDQLENLKTVSKQAIHGLDEKITALKQKNDIFIEQKEQFKKDISDLTEKLHQEKKNRIKMSQISEEVSELQNERIRFKREMQSAVEKSEISRIHEQNKAKQALKEVTELNLQLEEQKTILSTCESKILELSKDNKDISAQLSSIQKLWIEAQDKLEKEEMKSQSLERINRQLSKQGQEEKVIRATEHAHKPEETTPLSPIAENSDLRNKIQSVFASQYRTISKAPDLDV